MGVLLDLIYVSACSEQAWPSFYCDTARQVCYVKMTTDPVQSMQSLDRSLACANWHGASHQVPGSNDAIRCKRGGFRNHDLQTDQEALDYIDWDIES